MTHLKDVTKISDHDLRPTTWNDYIGQDMIKKNLLILLEAAQSRAVSPDHILLYGQPGLGKTTLAHLIAKHLGTNLIQTTGPVIEKASDLTSTLSSLSAGDVLFIDEIHRLPKSVEEILYPAMESGTLDIMIGKGPSARTVHIELQPFTLIGATTRLSELSSPLRSRFSGGIFKLEPYSNNDLHNILKRTAQLLEINHDEDVLLHIAERSRRTPRTANYYLRRASDLAHIRNSQLTELLIKEALTLLGISPEGLSYTDQEYIKALRDTFSGGPVGVKTIAAAIGEESKTVEDVIEPYLLYEGIIEKTPQGRKLTTRGYTLQL